MSAQAIPVRLLSGALRDRHQRPLRDLRISLVDRCNFRCPYCMPADRYPRDHAFLTRRQRLQTGEIVRLARLFVRLGVRKLRLTGGEPLLVRELPEIIAALTSIGGVEDLALTTNGSLLARRAAELRQAGLHRLTISLDSLDPQRFRRASGQMGELDAVLAGIRAAEGAGFPALKINTVVQRGVNDDEIEAIAAHFRGSGHVVRFIEYMDVGTCNAWQPEQVVPSSELLARIQARWPVAPVAAAYRGEVAERYRYLDGAGEIGFISSVSAPFCGDCARARLSADGKLYTCLFASHGHDLLAPMRAGDDDAGLLARIGSLWQHRDDRYSELRDSNEVSDDRRVEMYSIGG